MYNYHLHQQISALLQKHTTAAQDKLFYARFMANSAAINTLYHELYDQHAACEEAFEKLLTVIITAHEQRSAALQQKDLLKQQQQQAWFLSNHITGMSLYVDRFCGNLQQLAEKLGYFEKLGVNFLHLMPVFESPANESDGGYAVSNFRKVDERFGTIADMRELQQKMLEKNMYLMIDIVLNHTSHKHEWAEKARQGDAYYQDFFYFFNDRTLPDEYEKTMPEIFPEAAPGSFTYVPECGKWVMTVFHNYQWDLNYRNPNVLVAMLENILFYANLGVDILRIDAPAFIWKELGTTCQNLEEAHSILRLVKQCVQVAAPGMALLGEAIVAPREIMKYFGSGEYTAQECDFAYNATQMALQWDALATGNTAVMLKAQHDIWNKPYGTSWITYTRCHDDIGLGFTDETIRQAGFEPFAHRNFLKNYYAGTYPGSPASGALFSSNPKTGDARISGSLASLCGLEKALADNNSGAIDTAVNKILMMQALSMFIGGVPMLFYGDEAAYTNDYSYETDPGKSYDNRWMHRPVINSRKSKLAETPGTAENRVFTGTQKLISIRSNLNVVADKSNITWLSPHNIHVAGYLRDDVEQRLFCVFNFSNSQALLTWFAFKEKTNAPTLLYDHWTEQNFSVGADHEYLVIAPYGFHLLEVK
ncbi:alpha-amylase family glycosyl hydrolase [Foetidibacter luteolus]|uniref:alpha-amylase family glycosyl hydrolase n=1 Tax=Foetidibacter luteolus TaxID=2608880 RepID=UPI00129AEDD3|nr:alpha-amylase family glycosyl hydrolase [Foetidibacter luteolus]